MNHDYRVAVGFLTNKKTLRLKARLGQLAIEVLLLLWEQTAVQYPTGNWGDMDPEMLAVMLRWTGDPQVLWDALVGGGWLEERDGELWVHEWEKHNGYCAQADWRRERAKKAAAASWGANRGRSRSGSNASSIPTSKAASTTPSTASSKATNDARSNAPPPPPPPIGPQPHSSIATSIATSTKLAPSAEFCPPTAAPFSEEDQPQEHNGPADLTEERAKRDILQTLGRDPERLRKAEVSALRRIVAAKVPLDAVKEAHRRKSGEGVFKKGLDYLEPIIMEIHEEMARKLIEDRQREERNRELDRVNLARMRGNNGRAH